MPVPKQEKSTKRCVLIIEDEKPMARALELKLGSAGFETAVALDGAVALTLLEHERFDCILLDLIMPKVDGFAVLQTLRERKVVTPIIVMTNLSQPEDAVRAKKLGAREFLVKSNTPIAEVVDRVRKVLST